MGYSHLHTPRLNNISVYDPKVYPAGVDNFLTYAVDGVKFIPGGKYTMSSVANLPKNIHHRILGAGRVFERGWGSFVAEADGADCGFTQLIHTVSGETAIQLDTSPDVGYMNALTLRDLQISTDDIGNGIGTVEIIRGKYLELSNVGFDTYPSAIGSGYILDATGTDRVLMENVDVYGYGESSSANETALMYIRFAKEVSMKNVSFNGITDCAPAAVLRFDDTPMINIENIYFSAIGVAAKSTVLMQFDAATSTAYKDRCSVKNLCIGATYAFTSSQTGIFTSSDAKLDLSIDGIYTTLATTSNRIRMCGTYLGNLIIHGDCNGLTAAARVPYGKVASPFDTSNNLLSPYPSGAASASAPVSSTNYICELRNANLLVRGGTGVVVTHSGVADYYDTSGVSYHMNVGETISFGPFTVAPTVSAYFER